MRPSTLIAVAVLLLAGCAGQSPPPLPPLPYVFVDPMSEDGAHDHADPAQHDLASNVTLVGHHFLHDEEAKATGSHSIDLCGDWVVTGRNTEFGVDIADVSDPTSPTWVGRFRDPNASPGDRDVAWSADCSWIYMANGGSLPTNSGVLVINAKDKARPTLEARVAIPGTYLPPNGVTSGVTPSVHTVFALKVGAEQYVYALNWGVHIFRHATGADGKATLVYAGRYATADAERVAAAGQTGEGDPNAAAVAARRAIYGHDLTTYVEGSRTIMYVAYAYDGLRIVDITSPAAPQELGHWVPETPGAPHYVHSVKSYIKDGRRITVLGAETFETPRNDKTPSPFWVLDTTDPTRIQHLSTWANPGGHGADRLFYSLHFYELDGERLWVTHYHGGVWVVDLSDPFEPRVEGYYMPHQDNGFRPQDAPSAPFHQAGIPMTYDLKVRDGLAYVADDFTGLYVLTLAAS